MLTDGQRTIIKWRRNIAKNFNHLSRVHERCRQTDDDRQTDGLARQRADMGRAKQPEAELQQVDRGHLQRPQAKATPCCGRYSEPVPLPGIKRSSCPKMLGVNIENNFSIAQHVQCLVTASAQTVYALRVLRTRGLDDDALQHIYRATVVARMTYAASAWHGLTKAPDRKRIDSVLDRARRHGYAWFKPPTEGFPWDDLHKILPGCRQVTNVLNGAETLPSRNTFCGTWYLPHSHVQN